MKTVTNTFRVSINVPPETAFAYVSDLARHSEWNDGLRVEPLTSGPVSAGSQYRSWGKPGNRLNEIKITDYQPPTRFTFVSSQAGLEDVRHEFTFSAQGSGTLVERTVTAQMPLLFEVVWRIVIWPLSDRPGMEKCLAALKNKLESSLT